MITVAILKAAEPGNAVQYCQSILGGMNKYAAAYKVNTRLRVAHFLAQIAHESGLKMVEESGNYSAERMRQIFGCRGAPGITTLAGTIASWASCGKSSGPSRRSTPTIPRTC